ncbi:MAG: trigger factor [Ignavibacteria bacterium CG08_land_8_20_14_0_20_37_9]|nr:MAG: trigger factor [Ignavibacteria bacterium CG08_land_8_20_14_0_20_37_9]PJC58871.1 MAG: trigger factor [Ignavibacteria bacterium CG_4_9_14_0_2_um_filter_37_13]
MSLETKINVISESVNELEVIAAYDDIKSLLDENVQKQMKSIQIDGFRKGKVPPAVIKRIYGDSLEYTAAEKVANKLFWQIEKEQNLKPINEPALTDIDFKPNEKLTFKVSYEIFPKIEPQGYSGLEIEVPDYKVTDAEIESEVTRLLEANATYEDAETVEDAKYLLTADIFTADENGVSTGIKMESDYKINLTNKNINKEIFDNALNKHIGDTFSFSFDEAHEHHDDVPHEHKKIFYSVVIKNIQKIVYPELNEEFLKKVTHDKITTEAELRENIQKDLLSYYESSINDMAELKLEQAVLKNNSFSPPKVFIKNYLDHLVKDEIDNYKKKKKKVNPEVIREKLALKAENSVKWILLKDKIIEKENILLSDERLKELSEENAEKMGVSADILLKHYQSDEMKNRLLMNEFYSFLKKSNTIKRIDPEVFSQKEEVHAEKH